MGFSNRCLPSVVLTISESSRFLIMSTTCGRPSRTLLTRWHGTPPSFSAFAVPPVATISKPRAMSILPSSTDTGLVAIAHADEREPSPGQNDAGSELRFCIRFAERSPRTHHLARRLHLGA
jgi:hypothetical protein